MFFFLTSFKTVYHGMSSQYADPFPKLFYCKLVQWKKCIQAFKNQTKFNGIKIHLSSHALLFVYFFDFWVNSGFPHKM